MTIEERLEQLERRNKRLTTALTLMAVAMSAVPAMSQEVLLGTPVWRCETGWQGNAQCEKLDEVKVERFKTKILRFKPRDPVVGKDIFIWGPDGREIELFAIGGWYDTWASDGMYIKVWRWREQAQMLGPEVSAGMTADADKLGYGKEATWLYMEHTQFGLNTITYYGIATTYLPPYAIKAGQQQ